MFEEQRNDLYKLMCNMLEVVTEDDFNEAYQRLRINYQGHPGVLQYVEKAGLDKIVYGNNYGLDGVECFHTDMQIQSTL